MDNDQTQEQGSVSAQAAEQAGGATPNWQDQDDVLRDLWLQNTPQDQIAEKLGRSVAAVMTRAVRLGLPRRSAPGRKPGYKRDPSALPRAAAKRVSSSVARMAREAAAVGDVEAARRANPEAAERVCLMCLRKFLSEGRHNRICPSCKGSAQYVAASGLPEIGLKSEI